METPQATRSSRRRRGEAPDEVTARAESPSTAVSGLTESTPAGQRAVEDRNNLTLQQLANVASPLVVERPLPLTPLEAEAAFDRSAYHHNAGASDSEHAPESEDEDDVDIDEAEDSGRRNILDALNAMEDRAAAEIPENEEVAGVTNAPANESNVWAFGAPAGWVPPQIPDGWKPNKARGSQPKNFDEVDNPGGWSEFSYQARFSKEKGGEYKYHCLPTGATPVPKDESTGKRISNGWEFHYDGWKKKSTDPTVRDNATREDILPVRRKGSLDPNIMRRLGMTQRRLEEKNAENELVPDALFFYQLLLPIHQIDNTEDNVSPTRNDPRQPFYAPTSKWGNLYAVGELNLGTGWGHTWENTTADELLRWDGVVVMDGVRGGSGGAIMRRFDNRASNTSYDKLIDESMTQTRFLEIKRIWKLCDNKEKKKKKHEEGYDPAYKYDYIFDTITHNTNALTLNASLDLAADETSFAHQGFGEAGTGIVAMVRGKPQVSKGMQTVVVSDVDYCRPRAYVHRHKLNKRYPGIPWSGQNEIRALWETQLRPLCTGTSLIGRPIFAQKPHLTVDNHFSGIEIMEYAAEQGFGFTSTIARNRMPKKVPSKYWCLAKTNSGPRVKHA